jgi:tetratricopeptide (TPR) repeat protein
MGLGAGINTRSAAMMSNCRVAASALARCCWLALCCAYTAISLGAEVQSEAISTFTHTNAPTALSATTNEPVVSPGQTSSFAVPAGSTIPANSLTSAELTEHLRSQLELARHYRHIRQPREAEPVLIDLISGAAPEGIKQQALLELAMAAKDAGDSARAQQVYAQYLSRWPNDLLIPEILLRQGQLFREMGLNNLALAKFYAVMTSSLVLKNDKLDYYQRLVLAAQTEIAETHYQLGKYSEAADFFSRLLKQANTQLNRLSAQYRLIRSCSALERNDEVVYQGSDFLARYSEAPEQPEVRFLVALALKRLGRNGESMQQVLSLLQEQKERTKDHPELWSYWQQQAGNEIGNQLYREGDYVRALSVYLSLAQLDPKPAWQLPVGYQIGLTYERLAQPGKALETYQSILQRESELGTNVAPGTKALLEMAKFRAGFVQWQAKAETKALESGPGQARPDKVQRAAPGEKASP